MRIAFDLDGTLYDSLSVILKVNNRIMPKFNYPGIKRSDYVRSVKYATWKEMYSHLGIKETEVDKIIRLFIGKFDKEEPLKLLPNAIETVSLIEKIYGGESIHFITNESIEGVKRRFERDGLINYLPKVKISFQGKSKEIYQLAIEDDSLLVYVGDTISDGEECIKARNMGAKNILFIGVINKHAINNPAQMSCFIKKNSDFARPLFDIKELISLLKSINH